MALPLAPEPRLHDLQYLAQQRCIHAKGAADHVIVARLQRRVAQPVRVLRARVPCVAVCHPLLQRKAHSLLRYATSRHSSCARMSMKLSAALCAVRALLRDSMCKCQSDSDAVERCVTSCAKHAQRAPQGLCSRVQSALRRRNSRLLEL
jgi:hypothetical protein